ncbi:MAG TPA: AraC family transcriptional regulator [Porphyromonadaceae bacterium]|nr:AraC family transcriptional regulator [Porphyromonadaceae bacterium]
MDNIISEINIDGSHKLKEVDYIDNDFVIFDDLSQITLANCPRRVNAMTFLVCLKGSLKVGINLQEYTITENTLLLTFPDQIIQNLGHDEDFSGLFIAISPLFIDRTFKSLKELIPFMLHAKDSPALKLNDKEIDAIKEYHSFLWRKVKMINNIYRKEVTRGILFALFYDMYNIIGQRIPIEKVKPSSRKEELFKKFIKTVSEHYKEERSVSFYSDKLCLTSKHLSGVVKEVSGKTAGEWIDSLVILEARTLLKTTDMSIQEIAEYLHFANQSFFGKYFKHYVGVSPREYRRL